MNTEEDASESGTKYGLLGAVESLVNNVFLPTIQTQNWDTDKPPYNVKTELINSLTSFVHVLTSMLI